MIRIIKAMTAILAAFIIAMPVSASQLITGVWEYQNRGDPYYTEGSESAAVVENETTMVVITASASHQDIAIHVRTPFYGDDSSPLRLELSLVMADGETTATFGIKNGNFTADNYQTSQSHVDYYLRTDISAIPLLQAASILTVRTHQVIHDFSLKGSRVPLDQVLAGLGKATPKAETNIITEEAAAEAMYECDSLVAHPKNPYNEAAGVPWDDIDTKAAIAACERAIVMGNNTPRMYYQLGRAYDKAGNPKALEILRKAALELRYPFAFSHFGNLHRHGKYTAKNSEFARSLYKQGTDLGDAFSKYYYGRILVTDGNRASDLKLGLSVMKEIADSGDSMAQRVYGDWMVDEEYGITPQPDVAREYLSHSADDGDIYAAYKLAQMYADGKAGDDNPALHLRYLKLAAKGGHAKAKTDFGYD